MKLNFARLLPLFLLCLAWDGTVRGDEGWKFPNLNPFSQSDNNDNKSKSSGGAPATGVRPQASSKSAVGPANKTTSQTSWNPFAGSATAAPKKPLPGSAALNKAAASSQSAMTKTKQTLMPWTTPKPPSNQPVTGTNRIPASTAQSQNQSQESKGLFASWMKPTAPPPAQPKSVQEFLNQPRVPY